MDCFFTSPQSSIITFLNHWLQNFGDFYWILISWFIKMSVQTFQALILIYRRGNFVNYQWFTSDYRPLSYPFRSLSILTLHHLEDHPWWHLPLLALNTLPPKNRKRNNQKYPEREGTFIIQVPKVLYTRFRILMIL